MPPIQNAADQLLDSNTGTLPNVQGAMANWFQPLSFKQITKSVVNFQNVETTATTRFQGVRQPLSAQKLMMKPEGQRSWRWETIHAYPDLILQPDDIIIFSDRPYRVMEKYDWQEYGYLEYHITQDYTS